MKIKVLKKEDLTLLKRAFRYVFEYKVKIILAFLFVVGGIVIGVVQPLFWGGILDSLFQKNMKSVELNIIYTLIFSIIASILSYFQDYIFAFLNQNIIFDLKRDMYKSMLDLPVKAYDEINNGELMSRLHGDASVVASAITGTLVNTIVDIIRIIVVGISIFAISTKLALIVIITFPVSFYIFNIYGKKIRMGNKHLSQLNDKFFSSTGQTIWGIREVKSLGIKEDMFDSFAKLASKLKDMTISVTLLSAKSQAMSSIANTITQLTVTLVGGSFVINGSLDIKYFIAFNSYSNQFSGSLLSISRLNLTLQQVMNSLERMFLLMDGLSYSSESFGEKSIANITGEVKFENVSFSYEEHIGVLNDVTIHIPAKSRTAIVGSSGSGKTTIFNLLLRLYNPCKGRIYIDGTDISEIKEADLRKYISVVRQEPVLFTVSIKENLLLAKENASEEEIESACKRAYIHEFIESLPNKYDSVVGENGVNLSGGQRQRIAIARALLKKSKIILFDEATSSLDNESQFYIKKAIDTIAKECTVVLIAHRLSTIIEADVIYVMDKGEVVGQGTHYSLINTNKVYKKLYKAEVELINDNSREVI